MLFIGNWEYSEMYVSCHRLQERPCFSEDGSTMQYSHGVCNTRELNQAYLNVFKGTMQ
jgi:hypothetical protein